LSPNGHARERRTGIEAAATLKRTVESFGITSSRLTLVT